MAAEQTKPLAGRPLWEQKFRTLSEEEKVARLLAVYDVTWELVDTARMDAARLVLDALAEEARWKN